MGSVHRLLKRCMQPRGKITSALVDDVGATLTVVPSAAGAAYPGHLLETPASPVVPVLVAPLLLLPEPLGELLDAIVAELDNVTVLDVVTVLVIVVTPPSDSVDVFVTTLVPVTTEVTRPVVEAAVLPEPLTPLDVP